MQLLLEKQISLIDDHENIILVSVCLVFCRRDSFRRDCLECVCQERQERQHERTSLKESARRGADQFGYKSKGRHVRRELRTELRTEKEEDAKNSR